MLTLHTFASGSEGNCLLLQAGQHHILLDAGISCRRITSSLAALHLTLDDLDAVLITHEHSDHVGGLATLVKRCRVPIYMTAPTAQCLTRRIAGIEPLLRPIASDDVFSVGDVRVSVFPTSHDAAGSVDYRFDGTDGGSVGVLTDTGYVTDGAAAVLSGVELLVLESNHDVVRLKSGPYPYALQQRILGDFGHLSNDSAAHFAAQMAQKGTKTFVLAHLSRENNTPQLAEDAVSRAVTPFGAAVHIAPRSELSAPYRAEAAVCRR